MTDNRARNKTNIILGNERNIQFTYLCPRPFMEGIKKFIISYRKQYRINTRPVLVNNWHCF